MMMSKALLMIERYFSHNITTQNKSFTLLCLVFDVLYLVEEYRVAVLCLNYCVGVDNTQLRERGEVFFEHSKLSAYHLVVFIHTALAH